MWPKLFRYRSFGSVALNWTSSHRICRIFCACALQNFPLRKCSKGPHVACSVLQLLQNSQTRAWRHISLLSENTIVSLCIRLTMDKTGGSDKSSDTSNKLTHLKLHCFNVNISVQEKIKVSAEKIQLPKAFSQPLANRSDQAKAITTPYVSL